MTKIRVGLLFGGCSGEHEVSISSARAIAQALASGENSHKYELQPFYIQKDGLWQGGNLAQEVLTSGEALQLTDQSQQSTNQSQKSQQSQKSTEQIAGQELEADTLLVNPFTKGELIGGTVDYSSVDVWFPILHGPNGEDGTVQGLLKLLQVPFVGSGVLGSALGMDKIAMKMIFAQAGLPQVKYGAVQRSQIYSSPCVFPELCDSLEAELGYPCFVKPANLGSSVGISKVRTRKELEAALDSAASYDRRIIVEAGVVAREVECAVLGNDHPKASVVGEISFTSDFYDYETKYTEGLAGLAIPANLPDAITQKIQEMAIAAFQALDCAGLARVDFFYVEATGEVLINEINTMPGFTATSMYPQLWAATGLPFAKLVDQLVQLALERHA